MSVRVRGVTPRLLGAGVLALVGWLHASSADAATATVSIGDTLQPAHLTVAPGTTVTWVNDDDERHRVRSRDGATAFDSGNLEPGERFTFAFEAAGEHPYVDERDPEDAAYHGTVTVTSQQPGPGDQPPAPDGQPAGERPTDTNAEVTILDRSFSPRTITVGAGARVTWTNRSDRDHTVTFESGGGSGQLGGGATFAHTFRSPGTYGYLCALHPEMTGTVNVTGDGAGTPAPNGATTTSESSPAPTTGSGGPSASSASRVPPSGAVRIVDLAFQPPRLRVAPGATVTWDNAGVAPHTVTGDGFDSGTMRPGDRFSRRFDAPGTYAYRCVLHPQMTGQVVVAAASGTTATSEASGAATTHEATASPADAPSSDAAGTSPPSTGRVQTTATRPASTESSSGPAGVAVGFVVGAAVGVAGGRRWR